MQIDVYIKMRSSERRRKNCLISKGDLVNENVLRKNNCNEFVKFVSYTFQPNY